MPVLTSKVIACLIGLALLVSALAGGSLWIRGIIDQRDAARVEAALHKGKATVSEGQAQASLEASRIIDQGNARHQVTLTIEQQNKDDIYAASGSSQKLDTELNRAGRRGMCSYPDYADDPECTRLQQADPGKL